MTASHVLVLTVGYGDYFRALFITFPTSLIYTSGHNSSKNKTLCLKLPLDLKRLMNNLILYQLSIRALSIP